MIDYKSSAATEILGKLTKRYLIVGTTGINLYGLDCKPDDIDIWLDPTISVEEWDNEVSNATKNFEKIWSRGDKSEFGGYWPATRIYCKPILDIIRNMSGLKDEEFDGLYDRSLISKIGNVAPLDAILRSKYRIGRPKDLLKIIELNNIFCQIRL